MAISTTTGWIDNNGFRTFYKHGKAVGRFPMPDNSSELYRSTAMNTILDILLNRNQEKTINLPVSVNRENMLNYSALDFVEIGIMVGNRLERIPSE